MSSASPTPSSSSSSAFRSFYESSHVEDDDQQFLFKHHNDTHQHHSSSSPSISISPTDPRLSLLSSLRTNIIGYGDCLPSPLSLPPSDSSPTPTPLLLPILYADHIASSKPLSFIESYLSTEVLPYYANTHTTSSTTGLQCTLWREEARTIIHRECGGTKDDTTIFVGNGTTGAFFAMMTILGMNKREGKGKDNRSENNNQWGGCYIFTGEYEHHSILLPLRDLTDNTTIITIPEDIQRGGPHIPTLEAELLRIKSLSSASSSPTSLPPLLIGIFSACSNVSGILVDTSSLTKILHLHGALAVFDYATAAPYIPIDLNEERGNPLLTKDAIIFSLHKFLGGISCPGVLMMRKKLFTNPIPHLPGGGTVFFVGKENHRYISNFNEREEGGTPNIIGCIRAGLVMKLKENIGTDVIEHVEKSYWNIGKQRFLSMANVILLGNPHVPRLPILSFLIRSPNGLFLHSSFVSLLLNDLFGIQSRAGCACSGPYAQNILGIPKDLATQYELMLLDKMEIIRPGFTRVNFHYIMSESEVKYICDAIEWISVYGWEMLVAYGFYMESGEWRHKKLMTKDKGTRRWIGDIKFNTKNNQNNSSGGDMTMEDGNSHVVTSSPSPSSPLLHDTLINLTSSISFISKRRTIDMSTFSYSTVLLHATTILQEVRSSVSSMTFSDQTIAFDEREETKGLRWFMLPSEAADLMKKRTEIKGNISKNNHHNITSDIQHPPFTPPVWELKIHHDGKREVIKREGGNGEEIKNPQNEIMNGNGNENSHSSSSSSSSLVGSSSSPSSPSPSTFPLCRVCFHTHRSTDSVRPSPSTTTSSSTSVPSTFSPSLECFACECTHYLPQSIPSKASVAKITKKMSHLIGKAINDFSMIKEGDKILVGVSGGKDSMSLLHCLIRLRAKSPVKFSIGAVTVDPQTPEYNPSKLKSYMKCINIPYLYESQPILATAQKCMNPKRVSICSFCSRMKRGVLYTAMRREGYNVLALGQHADDLCESTIMSLFHNGLLRTMKANYTTSKGDVRVIRPLVYVRERMTREYAEVFSLPLVEENCPACFSAPKERARVKKMLAAQETIHSAVISNILQGIRPLMERNTVESGGGGGGEEDDEDLDEMDIMGDGGGDCDSGGCSLEAGKGGKRSEGHKHNKNKNHNNNKRKGTKEEKEGDDDDDVADAEHSNPNVMKDVNSDVNHHVKAGVLSPSSKKTKVEKKEIEQ